MKNTLSKIAAGSGLIASIIGMHDLATAQTLGANIPKSSGIEAKLSSDSDVMYSNIQRSINNMRWGLTEKGYNAEYTSLDNASREAKSTYKSTNDPVFLALQVMADMHAAMAARNAASRGRNVAEHLTKAENKYKDALSAREKLDEYDPVGVIFSGSTSIKAAGKEYIINNLDETRRVLSQYRTPK